MRIPKMAQNRRFPLPNLPARRTVYKTLGMVVASSVLILFWDTLLPLLGEVLHVLVEFVEVMLERFLEKIFHWTPRQAQTFIAWSGLALLVYAAAWLGRKACAAIRRMFCAARDYANVWMDAARHAWGRASWLHFAGVAAAVGAALYLFI